MHMLFSKAKVNYSSIFANFLLMSSVTILHVFIVINLGLGPYAFVSSSRGLFVSVCPGCWSTGCISSHTTNATARLETMATIEIPKAAPNVYAPRSRLGNPMPMDKTAAKTHSPTTSIEKKITFNECECCMLFKDILVY